MSEPSNPFPGTKDDGSCRDFTFLMEKALKNPRDIRTSLRGKIMAFTSEIGHGASRFLRPWVGEDKVIWTQRLLGDPNRDSASRKQGCGRNGCVSSERHLSLGTLWGWGNVS